MTQFSHGPAGDMSEMIAQLRSVQEYMEDATSQAKDTEIEGRSADGSVVIRASLSGDFRGVEVQPSAVSADDNGSLRRLEAGIMAALNDLVEQQKQIAVERAGEMAARFNLDTTGI
jgi:DNA-binding protein YbaB